MSLVTTHVLDTAAGRPAAGIPVTLSRVGAGGQAEPVAAAVTDADGRARDLGPEELAAGTYQLTFDLTDRPEPAASFFPEIVIRFVLDSSRHWHVTVLLSPFSHTTYLGS